MALLLLTLLLHTSDIVHAIASPRETSLAEDVSGLNHGWTPKPTQAPAFRGRYGEMPHNALFARQEAQSNTCGWLNGNAEYPIICDTSSICALYGADVPAGFECCPTTSHSAKASFVLSLCLYKSKCLDYGEAGNSFSGASTTISNSDGVLSCGASAPYCFTVANSDTTSLTFFSYGCDTVKGAFFHAAMFTTTSGSVPASGLVSYVSSNQPSSSSAQSSSSPPRQTSSSHKGIAGTSSSTSSPQDTASSSQLAQSTSSYTSAPAPVGGSTGASKSAASKSSPNTSSGTGGTSSTGGSKSGNKSTTNVGAIAGGTVGGVAAVALIGAAVGYLMYRKKKQRVQAMPEVSQYDGGYDSHNNGGYGNSGGYSSVNTGYGNSGGYPNSGGYGNAGGGGGNYGNPGGNYGHGGY